jgi:hypothetical protein
MFDRAFVRFTANTRVHGDLILSESLGVIRFGLLVYPDDFPVPEVKGIVAANIGGFEVIAKVVSAAEIHSFTLREDESLLLLERFTNNEVVDFTLTFASGDEKRFKIYPSGDRNFYVWAEMFRTCIREHPNP